MSDPFLSEIKIVSFNFPPKGWALCNGQLLPINQNQALFALLGTTYGGNGQTTFALPNLRGQVPIHMGNGHTLGEAAGSTAVTLNQQQMPSHTHQMMASNVIATNDLDGLEPGPTKALAQGLVSLPNQQTTPANIYGTGPVGPTMNAKVVSNAGGSQPHNNMMPYLVLNFIIALQGIFPSRN
ncbi:MAG TPA: tail fiber protein [Beijerinckiaceae bacterium]|jgi:microcystin-dependent protein